MPDRARWLTVRRGLLAVAASGMAVVALGGTGTLAVFTDTATTGASGDPADMELIETAPVDVVVAGADIEIARYPVDPSCGTFQDQLDDALLQAVEVAPGATDLAGLGARGLCVRNSGDREVSVVLSAIDVSSLEISCEVEEGEVDPQGPTCGDLGESGQHVRYQATLLETVADPETCPTNPSASGPLLQLSEAASAFSLEPGETGCLAIAVSYVPPDEGSAVAAQTDRTRWRFQVEATAP